MKFPSYFFFFFTHFYFIKTLLIFYGFNLVNFILSTDYQKNVSVPKLESVVK